MEGNTNYPKIKFPPLEIKRFKIGTIKQKQNKYINIHNEKSLNFATIRDLSKMRAKYV